MAHGTVNALANKYDDLNIKIMFPSREQPKTYNIDLPSGKTVSVEEVSMSLKLEFEIMLHIITFGLYKPFSKFRRYSFDIWNNADIIMDFSGGDSFTDIYGVGRFIKISLIKLESIWKKKNFILMPQTLGPFNKGWVKSVGAHIVRKAKFSLFRDQDGYDMAVNQCGADEKKCMYLMDMAFYMEPSGEKEVAEYVNSFKKPDTNLVGINVSGLLYSGGYNHNNMFGLKTDYKQLVDNITTYFLEEHKDVDIVFVPHVIEKDMPVEDDVRVCQMLQKQLSEKYPNRVFVADKYKRQDQLKKIISSCDFFIGSRMHACIAALSTHVPTVPVAYSKKFRGVWNMVGLDHCIADPRKESAEEIMDKIKNNYINREQIKPNIENDVHKLYDVIDKLGEQNNG